MKTLTAETKPDVREVRDRSDVRKSRWWQRWRTHSSLSAGGPERSSRGEPRKSFRGAPIPRPRDRHSVRISHGTVRNAG